MKIRFYLSIIAIAFVFVACGTGDINQPENPSEKQYTIDPIVKSLSSELFNTNWVYKYTEYYNNPNGSYSNTKYDYSDKFILSFTDKIIGENKYQLLVNGKQHEYFFWLINEDGITYKANYYANLYWNLTSAELGVWWNCGCLVVDGYIYKHTKTQLIIRDYYTGSNKFKQHIYASSSSSGSGSTTYEKPDVGFYDFTATKTSLTIKYRIYNQDEAKVSSARIYYGTSSNPSSSISATVSGSYISATITGLKAGTTYYVKCEATGKGGTTKTSTTKCITNY